MLSERQQYQDLKRRIDVREVLDHYGATNVSEVISADGTTELVHSCLLEQIEPHHRNGDRNPSAWANTEKKLYCCAVYWAGDILHLIAKLEGVDGFSGVIPIIGDFLHGATRDAIKLRDELQKLFTTNGAYSIDLPSYSERVLDPWRVTHPYMRDVRGISQETQEQLRIGFDWHENRVVFPHFWEDRLVGWQKRVVEEQSGEWPGTFPQWPKYRNSSGFPKSSTLYAYDLKHRHAVVVESPMSVAKAHSLGVPGVVATFGAKVSKHQIELLREFDSVTVWFDDDLAGQSGERKIVENLHHHTEVRVVTPDQGKDLGDLDSAELIQKKIDSAIPAALRLVEYEEVRHA